MPSHSSTTTRPSSASVSRQSKATYSGSSKEWDEGASRASRSGASHSATPTRRNALIVPPRGESRLSAVPEDMALVTRGSSRAPEEPSRRESRYYDDESRQTVRASGSSRMSTLREESRDLPLQRYDSKASRGGERSQTVTRGDSRAPTMTRGDTRGDSRAPTMTRDTRRDSRAPTMTRETRDTRGESYAPTVTRGGDNYTRDRTVALTRGETREATRDLPLQRYESRASRADNQIVARSSSKAGPSTRALEARMDRLEGDKNQQLEKKVDNLETKIELLKLEKEIDRIENKRSSKTVVVVSGRPSCHCDCAAYCRGYHDGCGC